MACCHCGCVTWCNTGFNIMLLSGFKRCLIILKLKIRRYDFCIFSLYCFVSYSSRLGELAAGYCFKTLQAAFLLALDHFAHFKRAVAIGFYYCWFYFDCARCFKLRHRHDDGVDDHAFLNTLSASRCSNSLFVYLQFTQRAPKINALINF